MDTAGCRGGRRSREGRRDSGGRPSRTDQSPRYRRGHSERLSRGHRRRLERREMEDMRTGLRKIRRRDFLKLGGMVAAGSVAAPWLAGCGGGGAAGGEVTMAGGNNPQR